MADELISRKALLEDIEETVIFTVQKDAQSAEMRGANKVIDRIKAAHTVDAVEVVRCKDCKHYGGITFGRTCRFYSGAYTRIEMPEDGFCNYGERWEDDG